MEKQDSRLKVSYMIVILYAALMLFGACWLVFTNYALELFGYAISAHAVSAVFVCSGFWLMIAKNKSDLPRTKLESPKQTKQEKAQEAADNAKIAAKVRENPDVYKGFYVYEGKAWLLIVFLVWVGLGIFCVFTGTSDKREQRALKELTSFKADQCVLSGYEIRYSKYRVKPVVVRSEKKDGFTDQAEYITNGISASSVKVGKKGRRAAHQEKVKYVCASGKRESAYRFRELMAK